ncbi:MAG: hypothetical protein RB191_15480 [Terriglobia bacterium]|nr:hypothetical protein [Terriglobia bacterium]
MKPGDKIKCINAKEWGIPITEGEVYTVKTYGRYDEDDAEVVDESRLAIPAVRLVEVPGIFMATRFEVVS